MNREVALLQRTQKLTFAMALQIVQRTHQNVTLRGRQACASANMNPSSHYRTPGLCSLFVNATEQYVQALPLQFYSTAMKFSYVSFKTSPTW